jgi:hypothetical protein
LIGRISDTSNYVLATSNILVGRINDTSNYVLATSNILVGRISDTSNYVLSTSNILVGRISDTSNYVLSTSNKLVGRISDTSNYVLSTSNILVPRIMQEVGFTSNYVDRINTALTTALGLKQGTLTASTLSGFLNTTDDFVYNAGTTKIDLSKNTSNYVSRINTELNTAITTGLASATNYWTKDAGTNIYLNQAGNVGIGTITPNNNLHIYRPNNNIPSFTTQNYITTTTTTTITSTPTIASTAISGTIYKLMTFTYTSDTVGFPGQTQYIINVPDNVLCDILVIGGGGGGIETYIHFNGVNYPGGGGGAGALIHFENYVLSTGTYNIYVGKGGLGNGSSGTSSYIKDNNNIFIRASGGGGGGRWGSKNGDTYNMLSFLHNRSDRG